MAVITNETLQQINYVGDAYVQLGINKLGIVHLFGEPIGLFACASGHKPVSKMIYSGEPGANSKEIPLYVCPHVISPSGGAKTQVVEKPVYIEQDSSTFIPFGLGVLFGITIAMIGTYIFAKKNKGHIDKAFEKSERVIDHKIKKAQERFERVMNNSKDN